MENFFKLVAHWLDLFLLYGLLDVFSIEAIIIKNLKIKMENDNLK